MVDHLVERVIGTTNAKLLAAQIQLADAHMHCISAR